MIQVLVAPTFELVETIGYTPDITIEAEYGSVVVIGTKYTAAHHQPKGPFSPAVQPAPCNNPNIPRLDVGTILLSHTDLDSVGGALRALGHPIMFSEKYARFWAFAEFVDLHGPHRIAEFKATESDREAIYAWWAWLKTRPYWRKDQLTSITDFIVTCGEILTRILTRTDCEMLMADGETMRSRERLLDMNTYVATISGVILRKAATKEDHCNHLYRNGIGCVTFNEELRTVTVSIAQPIEGISCRYLVKTHKWSADPDVAVGLSVLAGGHDVIAGGPRGHEATMADAEELADKLSKLISLH